MASRDYMRNKRGRTMLTIHGFEEMAEILTQLEKRGVNATTEKLFDECCEIIRTSMDTYAKNSIPDSLSSKQTEWKVKRGNRFMYAYGFDKTKNPEEFLKACYLNYGTPRRHTKRGEDRGKVEPRGFISNGKRSAAQKINARKKTMMKELLSGDKK